MTGAFPGYPGAPLTYVADDALLMCVRDRGYVNLLRLDADGSRRTLVGGAQTVRRVVGQRRRTPCRGRRLVARVVR